jgi:hypothetical protein
MFARSFLISLYDNHRHKVLQKLMGILQNVLAYCWFEIFYIFHEKYVHCIHDDLHYMNYNVHGLIGK